MTLSEQYEEETGLSADSAGYPAVDYAEWLEAKVLEQQAPIQRVLAKLAEQKEMYGTQYPQLESWLQEVLKAPAPEVEPKDISNAIFRATHERGWFHEKDALDILSNYIITPK